MEKGISLIFKIGIRTSITLMVAAFVVGAVKNDIPQSGLGMDYVYALNGLSSLRPDSIMFLSASLIVITPIVVLIYMCIMFFINKSYRFFIINILILITLTIIIVFKTH